jgi:uncharacterized protein
VLGNHDRAYGERRVAVAVESAGIDVLRNRAVRLRHGGEPFWVAAVEDDFSGEPRVEEALTEVPRDEPVLVLTHSPDVFPAVPERVALTVAGHTHGGQVAVPGLRARVIPSRFGERYASGHVVEGGRHLYVHPGIGTSRLPVRLGMPPRVVVLTLLPARERSRRLRARRRGY